jgi:anti-sigma-K factor RskA
VNIELYIQSGIIESYALGLASPSEVAEFEQLLPHFPELKEALSDFEYHLELFAIENEAPPPPGARERIEARIRELPAVPEGAKGDERRVHENRRTWLIVFFVLSNILLAVAIYYFLEYRHARKQVQQMEEQLGKKEAGGGGAESGNGGVSGGEK